MLVWLVGQIHLCALIFQNGYERGVLLFFFDWSRLIYLHFNIEPTVISLTGLFGALAGVFAFINNARPAVKRRARRCGARGGVEPFLRVRAVCCCEACSRRLHSDE